MRDREIIGQWYWMPTAVFLLGIISTVMLFWVYFLGERQKATFEHVDALMDIQVKTATFHLLFEEAITEGRREDLGRTFAHLDAARGLLDAILYGGKSEHDTALTPLSGRAFMEHAENMRPLLLRLREISLTRYQNPETAGLGSAMDEQFDAVFEDFQKRARALEIVIEKRQMSNQAKTRRLILGTVVIWTIIVAGSITGLYSKERRRKQAELALEGAYAEMEQRVKTRTAELANTNSQLREEIAERKRAEESLRESERQFRRLSEQFHTLLNAIPDSITLLSPDLRILWANNSAVSAAKGADVADQHCYRLWHGAPAPCADCAVRRSFQTGKPENSQTSRPDGRVWDVRAFPMRSDDGKIESVIEIAADITEKLTLQAESLRAAHLASIGELAAGVAHEINNPINGIINYAQILIDERGGNGTDREVLGRIIKEGDRIATIVRSLLSFALERKEAKKPVRIHDILSETLALSATQLRKDGIVLNVDMPEDLPGVIAHSQQVQQVFLNIINNARYALNQKYPGTNDGKILDILGEEIMTDGCRRLRITFHDRGTGIPADKIDKVVDPFFTTKPRGVGTGLGLSISHGIISDHGGRLLIQSVEGQFTNVHVLLPTMEEA